MSDAPKLPAEVEHGFGFLPHRGLTLARGEACTVWDDRDRAYLDAGGANYGTMNVGHAHPRVVEAIRAGADQLTHTAQAFSNPVRSRLVDDLLAFTGPWAERVFLSNSGTEAIEAAIKLALVTTGRAGVVAFEGAFHGRTLGALAATHKPTHRTPFAGRLAPVTFVPYGDADALHDAVDDATACVLVEPVQGEGGVRSPPEGFLGACRDIAHDAGALLVVDEVQTGLGRTGHDLAIHSAGVEPDVVCLAKSLAAGLPLGATVAGEAVPAPGPGLHGSTFGGSPLACSVAREVLDIVATEELSQRATRTGARLVQGVRELDHGLVRELRGEGLMVGVELGARATPVLQALQRRGMLALPAGDNVVRLLPPLVLTDDEADRLVHALGEALTDVEARFARSVPS